MWSVDDGRTGNWLVESLFWRCRWWDLGFEWVALRFRWCSLSHILQILVSRYGVCLEWVLVHIEWLLCNRAIQVRFSRLIPEWTIRRPSVLIVLSRRFGLKENVWDPLAKCDCHQHAT